MNTLRKLVIAATLALVGPLSGQQIVGNLTVQQYVRTADGTAAAPSSRFTTYPTTGFFLSGANAIGVSTAGVERWTFNASGSLNPLVNNTYDIGNGTVNPRDVNAARSFIGPLLTNAGALTISTTASNGNVIVAPNGSGVLTPFSTGTGFGTTALRWGASYFSGPIYVGSASGTSPTISVTGSASPNETLLVTVAGTGTFNVLDGTANTVADAPGTMNITGPSYNFGGSETATLYVGSNTAMGTGVGGAIGFSGRYTGSSEANFAVVKGGKENASDANVAGYLAFGTRPAGGSNTERMRISSTGIVTIFGTNTLNFGATAAATIGVSADTTAGVLTINGPSGGSVAIKGTVNADAAAAGYRGELLTGQRLVASTLGLTTTAAADITSVSLTAGDWEVYGTVHFIPANTTVVASLIGSVSATTATQASVDSIGGYASIGAVYTSGGATMSATPIPIRISLAATTTYYLVATATFSISTCTAYGTIRARRVR